MGSYQLMQKKHATPIHGEKTQKNRTWVYAPRSMSKGGTKLKNEIALTVLQKQKDPDVWDFLSAQ